MIIAVGLDLSDSRRVERAIRRHPRLENRVFTPAERATCRKKKDPWRSFAARFAAKEAAMKALGTGWAMGVGWRDIEVTGGAGRPPGLAFHGAALERMRELGASRAHLSLTHEGALSAAVVILEG